MTGQTNPAKHHASPPELPAASGTGANWAQDAIVFGSIAMTSIAATVMGHALGAASVAEALPVGLATAVSLSAIHVLYGRRASRPDRSNSIGTTQKKSTRLPSAPASSRAARPGPAAAPPPASVANDVGDETTSTAATGGPVSADAPPDTETLQKLIADLARTVPGPKASTPDPDRAARPVPQASETAIDAALHAEARALRSVAEAMAEAAPEMPSFADTIDEALRSDRIATYLEPIQALDQRRARHFEVSIRLRAPDGSELAHEDVESAALRAGLLPRLDAAKLPRAARIATHLAERGRGYDILSTIAALSITDPAFQDVLAEVFYEHDTPHVVLSFTQDDVRDFAPVHWQALHAISTYGVRFAIEGVFDLDLDFEALKSCGFDYVKLEADVLLAGLPSPSGLIPADHLCRYFSTLGFSIVVAKLDDEDVLARVMGLGVVMGQGTLFGGRRPVKAEVLTGREAA